jgi:hypothetical protein
MVTDIFIDGATDATVQGTVVRVNLVVSSATEKDADGGPVRDVRHRLVMTSQAATELHARLEAALRRLAEAGVVTRREGGSAQL